MKRTPPWLTLLILAPLLGEIVSGHQPPIELCNPLSVLLFMLPYGLGALLCRELVRRWKKGWLSLVLLAAAYGIYEEAVVVRSVFNPDWSELDILKPYHILGVNWTYAEMLVHFHVLVSIAAAVFLAEMIHADRRREPWLSGAGLAACAAGLALWLPAGWLMTQYVPPAGGYVLAWITIAGLILAARLLPAGVPTPFPKTPPRPVFFLLLGFANMLLFFIVTYMVPEFLLPPQGLSEAGRESFHRAVLACSVFGLALLDGLTLWLLLRLSGNGGAWTDRHRLAWVAGGLGFFLLFNVFADLEAFAGRSCVSAAAVCVLAGLAFFIRRRPKPSSPESPHAAFRDERA
jgi:hypothetical protein